MIKLIAMCGAIGSGKDTVANYLQEQHGFTIVSFAEPLKRIAMSVYGLEYRHVFGTQIDKNEVIQSVLDADGRPRTTREILEWLGTEGFRTIDPNTWVKLGMRTACKIMGEGGRVVISDTRFFNEFEAVKNCGGEIWKVEKTGCGAEPSTGHDSDEQWRKWHRGRGVDTILRAEKGDLARLYETADSCLR